MQFLYTILMLSRMLSLESPVSLTHSRLRKVVHLSSQASLREIFMCYCIVESVAYGRNRGIALKLGKATDLP